MNEKFTKILRRPIFVLLRHNDNDHVFCYVVVQLFDIFFFEKGFVRYEELRKVKKALSSDAAGRGG